MQTSPKTPLIKRNGGLSKRDTHICARKLTPLKKCVHFCARKRACPNPRKMKKYEICEILFPGQEATTGRGFTLMAQDSGLTTQDS